mmetsp:Transcript_53282/g.87583  ORF Transcript_53282/g.87583 Transcript_53282/m.87583 type:complete len:203 (-) Transcript_53282:1672-2280(-)
MPQEAHAYRAPVFNPRARLHACTPRGPRRAVFHADQGQRPDSCEGARARTCGAACTRGQACGGSVRLVGWRRMSAGAQCAYAGVVVVDGRGHPPTGPPLTLCRFACAGAQARARVFCWFAVAPAFSMVRACARVCATAFLASIAFLAILIVCLCAVCCARAWVCRVCLGSRRRRPLGLRWPLVPRCPPFLLRSSVAVGVCVQ